MTSRYTINTNDLQRALSDKAAWNAVSEKVLGEMRAEFGAISLPWGDLIDIVSYIPHNPALRIVLTYIGHVQVHLYVRRCMISWSRILTMKMGPVPKGESFSSAYDDALKIWGNRVRELSIQSPPDVTPTAAAFTRTAIALWASGVDLRSLFGSNTGVLLDGAPAVGNLPSAAFLQKLQEDDTVIFAEAAKKRETKEAKQQ
eukprot:GHVR01061070.1.p1 GENE.GHVR01061070.1~~GHVR01061070.1.p1  ORF type:complete len:201 (+),score=31.73 GHVR01061070.1:40-642(+)